MLRIFVSVTILFATTELQAQGIGGFVQQVTPGPARQIIPRQVIPQQLTPQQLPSQALSPKQMVPKELAPDRLLKEGEKLLENGAEAVQAGTSVLPGAGGAPLKIDCPLDKLVDAAKSLESLAKSHAGEVKKFNDEMANTAKNVGEAQLSIIKKTAEEMGNLLLKPFEPLINVAKKFLEYYNTILSNLEYYGIRIIAVAGLVIGLLIGLPFVILIRAITPRRKTA